MAEQQTPLALRINCYVHVCRLRGLIIGFLIKRLPGNFSLIEVAIGRLATNTLT